MQIKWKTLIFKTTIWLVTEICLGFLGLDNLADYDEFLHSSALAFRHSSLVLAIDFSLLFNTKQGKQQQWIFSID
jgi:hypothetical protein